jgi:hypothetical protein
MVRLLTYLQVSAESTPEQPASLKPVMTLFSADRRTLSLSIVRLSPLRRPTLSKSKTDSCVCSCVVPGLAELMGKNLLDRACESGRLAIFMREAPTLKKKNVPVGSNQGQFSKSVRPDCRPERSPLKR